MVFNSLMHGKIRQPVPHVGDAGPARYNQRHNNPAHGMWPTLQPRGIPRRALVPRPSPRPPLVAILPGCLRPCALACAGAGRTPRDAGCGRDPVRIHPVRGHAGRRGAAASAHAADRRGRSYRHLAVQDRGCTVRRGTGAHRIPRSPGQRMGDDCQPVRVASGLCVAVEALRGESRAGLAAEPAPRRLERRPRIARDDLRAVVVPRQYRRRAHRRHHRARRVPRQGAHRLSRGHRRRVERGWLGQRGRRHDDHHDVDRRGAPAASHRSLHRRWRGHAHLRGSGVAATAPLLADHARCARRTSSSTGRASRLSR